MERKRNKKLEEVRLLENLVAQGLRDWGGTRVRLLCSKLTRHTDMNHSPKALLHPSVRLNEDYLWPSDLSEQAHRRGRFGTDILWE